MNERYPPPIRVLCVDDRAAERHSLGRMVAGLSHLQLAGEASTGEEALALCEQLRPDVVLMSVAMPAIGAIGRRWPHLPVIAVANSASDDTIEQARRAGAAGCLVKSVTPHELGRRIGYACVRARHRT